MLRRPIREIRCRFIYGISWINSGSEMQRIGLWQTAVRIQVNIVSRWSFVSSIKCNYFNRFLENIWQRRSALNSRRQYSFPIIRIELPMPLDLKLKKNSRSMNWIVCIRVSIIKMSTPKKLLRRHGFFDLIQIIVEYLFNCDPGMMDIDQWVCWMLKSDDLQCNAVDEIDLINESTSATQNNPE